MTSDPIPAALRVAEILGSLGIEYWLGGSLASSIHGEPRSTHDVDFVVDMTLDQCEGLVAALRADYFVDDDFVRTAVRRKDSFQVDALWVTSAEDIVLQKLLWYRKGDEVSDRQWRDVLGVLKANPELDTDHMDRWAARIGVQDLLVRARREAGVT